MQKEPLEIKAISLARASTALQGEVEDLYARVFAGPPWFEDKMCPNCEEAYGGDDLRRVVDGEPCRSCGQPLKLVDYWRGKRSKDLFEDAIFREQGFIGVGARKHDTNQLIGFSWGYQVPNEPSPSVDFPAVRELLKSRGIELDRLFYAAETGVDPAFQHRKVGSRISYTRIHKARELGFHGVCFRTINPRMVDLFASFFGDENVRRLFFDPDPVKADRLWYYCNFAQIQERPEFIVRVGSGGIGDWIRRNILGAA